jgi:single-stranded-DNA-specific exonuclease
MPFSLKPAQQTIVVRPAGEAAVLALAGELGVSPLVARILVGRRLLSLEECRRYFRPQLSHFNDPFLFSDMEKACDRICRAISLHEQIFIYGDYDVDGITATALLLRLLRTLGAACDYYLPNRLTEGYGMSMDGVRALCGQGVRLIISVDCGITACREIACAASLGIDVIVTDHHVPKAELPQACAVLDPKVPHSGYPDDSLAGVGIALKLGQALVNRLGKDETLWSRYLDLAAVGTAADVVPMTGENRVIASLGFTALQDSENPGLRALLSAQGCAGKPLSTSEIVFRIAPSINAVGRLGDPRRGVELLITDDEAAAQGYARELREANVERRALDSHIQEEAFAWVDTHCDAEKDYAIVAGQKNWHCGVVGIVASKVVERYHRPAILFSVGDNGIARGSGRSIPNFHLHDALMSCSGLLEGFGGHAAAAGMTIREENLDRFRERINEIAHEKITPDDLVPKVTADAQVRLSDLTPKFFSILKQMEPFGPGNMRPVFVCRDVKNKYGPRIVGNNHLKMTVKDGACAMDAVAFNFGDRLADVSAAEAFTLAFSLDENEWNGRRTLQMKVKGVQV